MNERPGRGNSTAPTRRRMTTIHPATKPTWRWTFCTVAVILALGLMWLALEGGAKQPLEISGGPAGSSSYSTSSTSPSISPNSEHFMLMGLEPRLNPASLEWTAHQRPTAGADADNATALALGSGGAVTLVGLVLLLAWKLRHGFPAQVQERRPQWSRLIRRATSV